MKIRSLLLAGVATLGLVGVAHANPAWVKGNSCGATASATTIVCNIRSDGAAVASGDAVLGAFVWDNHPTALNTSAVGSGMTLTFASGPPAAVAVGQFIADNTLPSAITPGTTITAVNTVAHTITISSSAASVGNGDGISISDASITDDKSNVYTLGDARNSTDGTTPMTVQMFRALNLTNAPTQLTVTYAASTTFRGIMSDEYSGLNAYDVHAISQQVSSSNPITSGSVTTSGADLVYAATYNGGGTTTSAGSGFTLRECEGPTATGCTSVSGNFYGATEDFTQTAATGGQIAGTFSASASNDYITAVMAFTPATNLPYPTAISCPAGSLLDNAAMGATVCAFTVTMSDGNPYSGGTNTITPGSLFGESSSTGNGNVTLAVGLNGIASDGAQSFTMTAAKNGVTVTQQFTVTVVPASATGNPYSLGWKNIDPGASATDGSVIFTAPRTMTVNEIAMRVVTPAAGTALVDVYKASPGTACANGLKLHTGDLNAAGGADHVQTAALNTANTSLAIYDSVCLVTSPSFPTTGQATVTVTAN